MTKDKIIKTLKGHSDICWIFMGGGWQSSEDDNHEDEGKEKILVLMKDLGLSFKRKSSSGGDDCWSVYEFTTKEGESFLLKFAGHFEFDGYSSYSGSEFEDVYEVEPYIVPKIEYKRKN